MVFLLSFKCSSDSKQLLAIRTSQVDILNIYDFPHLVFKADIYLKLKLNYHPSF